MSLQAKPQLVEAVMFFRAGAICKEMHLAEFEAVLDGVVSLHDFADEQIQAAYALISPRLHILAVTFFLIDFDESGRADTGWNIPLRHLAEQGVPGPDLGGGPIRLTCRSRCPVAWYQMHLWDPSLKPGRNELVQLRDAARRNHLGILAEGDAAPAGEGTQWVAPETAKDMARHLARKVDLRHRQRTAQLLRQQRLRLHGLTQQYEEQFARLRLDAEQRERQLQAELEALQEDLREQRRQNDALQAQVRRQTEQLRQARATFTRELSAARQDGQLAGELLRNQLEQEVQQRLEAVRASYEQNIAGLRAELEWRNELDAQMQDEIERLRERAERPVERLAELGVMFVAYHPGTGHLTIPPGEVASYQRDPEAYVAARCLVTPEHYRAWLEHYRQPACAARLSSGERCAIPLDRIETPSRFVPGQSDCCARHQAGRPHAAGQA